MHAIFSIVAQHHDVSDFHSSFVVSSWSTYLEDHILREPLVIFNFFNKMFVWVQLGILQS